MGVAESEGLDGFQAPPETGEGPAACDKPVETEIDDIDAADMIVPADVAAMDAIGAGAGAAMDASGAEATVAGALALKMLRIRLCSSACLSTVGDSGREKKQ